MNETEMDRWQACINTAYIKFVGSYALKNFNVNFSAYNSMKILRIDKVALVMEYTTGTCNEMFWTMHCINYS